MFRASIRLQLISLLVLAGSCSSLLASRSEIRLQVTHTLDCGDSRPRYKTRMINLHNFLAICSPPVCLLILISAYKLTCLYQLERLERNIGAHNLNKQCEFSETFSAQGETDKSRVIMNLSGLNEADFWIVKSRSLRFFVTWVDQCATLWSIWLDYGEAGWWIGRGCDANLELKEASALERLI